MKIVSSSPLMRHIIGFFSTILIVSISWGNSSPLSETALQTEFQPLSGIKTLSADFSQVRSVKAWNTEISTKGHFSVQNSKEKKILWEVSDPTYMAMKMVPKGLFFKSSNDAKASWQEVKNKKVSEQMKNVFSWLSFDVQKIQQDFEVKKIKSNRFSLTPKNKKSHFTEIQLTLNSKKLIDTIVMVEENSDTISIHFSKTKVSR